MALNLDPEFQQSYQVAVEDNDSKLALRLAKQVQALIDQVPAGSPGTERVELQDLFARIATVAMRHLSESMLVDLFENHSAQVFSMPESVDVLENFKAYLSFVTFIEDRNDRRKKVRAAIETCQQTIGVTPIKLGQEQVPPTISNWVRLYRAEVGIEPATTIKVARFYTQNASVRALPPKELESLKRLLSFYEYLKYRSDQVVGFEDELILEDETGKTVIVGDGNIRPLITKADLEEFKLRAREGTLDRAVLASLMADYPDDFREFFGTIQETPAVAVDSLDPAAFQQSFATFVTEQRAKFSHRVPATGVPLPNRTAALVAMLHKAMARGQEADMVLAKEILQFVVSDRERFVNFMRHSSVLTLLDAEMPKQIGEKNKQVVRQSPTSPMALQALLIIVFGQRFKLSEDEVAWQAFDVAQRAPLEMKELKTVVTYDPGQNKLVWRYQ